MINGNGNYYGGYNPAYDAYYGTPYMNGRVPNTPPVENALSGEEIKILMNTKPNSDKLNLNISKEDYLRAMCTHRDLNGNDAVREMTDGSKNVWCPICGAIWNPTEVPLEEVKDAVKTLINHMENAKWIGNYPKAVTRQYFNMLPLVRKFPDLYDYAGKSFDSVVNQRAIYNSPDNSLYNEYNQLYNGMSNYNNPWLYYQQPNMGYQQPYQQPMGNPNPNYNVPPAPMQPPQMANPAVNPMQANAPQPAPTAPPPEQNAYYYNSGYAYGPGPGQNQGYGYAPTFSPAQPQQQNQQTPPPQQNAQPAAQNPQPAAPANGGTAPVQDAVQTINVDL